MSKQRGTDYAERLEMAIKLSYPVINVVTFEASRASVALEEITKGTSKAFVEMPFQKTPSQPTLKAMLSQAQSDYKEQGNGKCKGMVVFDPYFMDRQRVNPETLPALRGSVFYMENEGINYIIVSKDSVSDETAYHVPLPPMRNDEIIELLTTCEGYVSKQTIFSADEHLVIANHAKGLSHTQMKNIFTFCAFLKHKDRDYMPEIRREKNHMLRSVGLEVLEPIPLIDVGGLKNLKEFLAIRKAGWEKDLPVKGLLLAGVPGGGKTLVAKAAADIFGTTLLRLDIGRFYSKYLGETEREFNRALETVDEISPVVVLIDEIEKFLGVGEQDHAVSRRLLGAFLYWLQERKGKVFVVATANRVASLPPELMRAGRWDRAFFIDLPNDEERTKIFQIHLNKQLGSNAAYDISGLVSDSQGYTGAEIEQAIIDAAYLANATGDDVTTDHLTDAISRITPTIEMRRDDIERIRALKNHGFYPANRFEIHAAPDRQQRRVATN
ncbi:MAG: AAA family ATPase [Pseudomonadales bacterium]